MQTISLADNLYLQKREDKKINIEMNKNIVSKKDNVVYSLLKFYNNYYDIEEGYDIYIEKNIPVGAGLGGSSADAAGVLRGIEKLNGFKFDEVFINKVSKIGADIPFLYRKGMAKIEGIGEKVSMLPYRIKGFLVIGYPNISIKSSWAYKNSNFLLTEERIDSSILLRCLKRGKFGCICQNLFNRFEQLVFSKYPLIKQLKNDLIDCNASAALMSGSGSSVFAVFESKTKALEAIEELQSSWYWLELAEFEY